MFNWQVINFREAEMNFRRTLAAWSGRETKRHLKKETLLKSAARKFNRVVESQYICIYQASLIYRRSLILMSAC